MPLFRYRPVSGSCKLCGSGFECPQAAGAVPLVVCLRCGQQVARDYSLAPHLPHSFRPPSISTAKQAGFAVLKRTTGGEFEKL